MGVAITQSIQPTQRAAIIYNVNATVPTSMRNKHSFSVLGRELGNPGGPEAAAAGAIVAAYINCSVFVNSGTYHNYLYGLASGSPVFTQYGDGGTSYGPPIDYTIISDADLAAKYDATVRKLKQDFPFINTLFLDDCGPDWAGYQTLGSSVREVFYQKHIVIAQKMRALADEFGMLMMTNGEWRADSNFGYPQRNQWGCSLYDGFCIEHHAADQLPFWVAVGNGQWRLRDPQGQRCMFFIADDQSQFNGYINQPNIAWMGLQTTPQYTSASPNVSTGLTPHDLGLVFAGDVPTTTVTVTPATADVQTGGTVQFSAAVSPAGGTLTWSVNDIAGGNSTVGTITSGGLYTAPGAVPQGGTVTVRATHSSGSSDSSPVTVSASAPPPPLAELPPPPAIPNKAFGNRFAGLIANDMSANYARGVIVSAPPEDGLIDALRLGCDGMGPGVATQPYRLLVYPVDAQGNGGALRGQTVERSIVDQDAPDWPRSAATAQIPFTANEVLLLVIDSGGTDSNGRFYRNDSPNASRGLAHTYSAGAPASFAAASVGSAGISIYAEYTPVGVAGVSLAGALHLDFAMAGNARAQAVGGSIVPPDLVLQRNRYELRIVPVSEFFLNLGDGVPGARLVWQASDGTFRFLDEQ